MESAGPPTENERFDFSRSLKVAVRHAHVPVVEATRLSASALFRSSQESSPLGIAAGSEAMPVTSGLRGFAGRCLTGFRDFLGRHGIHFLVEIAPYRGVAAEMRALRKEVAQLRSDLQRLAQSLGERKSRDSD